MSIASIVEGIISSQQGFAEGALATAEGALETLGGLDFNYTTYGYVGNPQYSESALVEPNPVNLNWESGEPPDVGTITMPTRPTRPVITMPTKPIISYPTTPEKPSITTPTMESVTLGALMDYIVPEKPPISLPSYDVVAPVTLTITPIEHFFSIDEFSILDDPLIDAIRKRLSDNVTYGGTGLLPSVEEAIWNRNLERNERQLSDTVDKTYRTWAARGFSLPDGPLADSIATIQRDYMDKRLDLSREIAVKQAELEQTNVFKSMELGITLVGKLAESMIEYDKLILQVQEETAKFANEYIRLQIETNNNLVEVYKAKIQAYELRLKGELAKVDIYKADIDAALGTVQMNESVVKVYSAQIDAAVSKYKGAIEGNVSLVQMFSEEVRAVLAQTGIEEAKIKVYSETIKAAAMQAELYKTEVDAMTAEINAEKAKIDANVAQIDGWAKKVGVEAERYKTQIEQYRAQAQYNASVGQIEAAFADANARMYVGAVGANAEFAKVEQASMAAYHSMRLKAAEGVATAASHLAAGAMAAVHAQAQLASTESSKVLGGT